MKKGISYDVCNPLQPDWIYGDCGWGCAPQRAILVVPAYLLYRLPLTFCLSSIFMAKYCSAPLCFTSMTLPNEPVPRVFNLSKSSRPVVLCGNNNALALCVDRANIMFSLYLFSPVVGIPTSVRNLLWLWQETLSLKEKRRAYWYAASPLFFLSNVIWVY